MPFPTIRSSALSASGGGSINYPATVNAGDILILSGVYSAATAQSGWTIIATTANFGGAFGVLQYKVATGTEGGGSFATSPASYGYLITSVDSGGALPEGAIVGSASLDTPNPPALTPSAGVKDYLWIVWGWAVPTEFTTPHTTPSGFTTFGDVNGSAAAYRNLNASTLDPSAWGDSNVGSNVVYSTTVAIALKYLPTGLFFGSNF